jgi:hypothetical protein
MGRKKLQRKIGSRPMPPETMKATVAKVTDKNKTIRFAAKEFGIYPILHCINIF